MTGEHEHDLDEILTKQAVVVIESDAEVQRGIARLDIVLDLRRLLLDGEGLIVGEG